MKRLLAMVLVLTFGVALAQTGSDTFVYQSFGDVDTLDPAQAYDSASGQVIENVYEGLYGYAGDSVTEYKPLLAESYEASANGLTYTFKLRQGVKFHSGNPFTCKDVEYSIKRALVVNPADSGVGYTFGPALSGYEANANDALAAEDGTAGTDEQYADYWKNIANSVTCVDDYTAQFNLVQANPAFFSQLLFYGASIVDSEFAKANGGWDGTEATWRDWVGKDLREGYLQTNMSGTGAYKLTTWEPGIRVVAEANNDYWGGAPVIKNVILQQVEDEAARIQAIKAGDADEIILGSRSSLPQVEGQAGVKVLDASKDTSLGWSAVAVTAVQMSQNIDMADNVNIGSGKLDGLGIPADFFSDIHVRKCFNYAFDVDAYIQDVLVGAGQQITMALPPSYLGYDANIPVYTLDLEKAEEECKQAWNGDLWEKGFYLTIAYNTGNTSRQTIAEILKDNLEYLNPNFKVETRGIQWSQFLDERRSKRLPVSTIAWIPDFADPDNYIHTFYSSTGLYGGDNGYKNEQIDELDAKARTSLDPEERTALYSQIGNIAYEDAPYILVPQGIPYLVVSDSLQGVYLNPMYSASYLWKDVSKN
jgi:peptide/nickel transport system substrate-binding protein